MSERTLVVDFDGTVTTTDLLDTIASRFGDPVVYQEVEDGLDEGRMSLREVITREFRPVTKPLEEVVRWELENVEIRPGFGELVRLARERCWRLVIVSSGFHELIEPILEREGLEVELHANRVDPRPDGWVVDWRYDESCESCGESCKRSIVRGLAAGGEIVYVGDGYSDRCAAEASDAVFATRGLARYLEERGIAFVPFDDFHQVAAELADGGLAFRDTGYASLVDWKSIGYAATASGWRGRVAEAVEGQAQRSSVPVRGHQARALLGLVFLGISVAYLVQVARRLARA